MTERRSRMPSAPPSLPLFAHADLTGDTPRAARQRHARLRRYCTAIALGIAVLSATIAVPPRPRLVWNASASAPVGLYAVMPGARLGRGDMAVGWAPPGPRALAAARHYLPRNVPLVKRVRAIGGDRVCATGRWIAVNRVVVAQRETHDPAGRPLPWWRGCTTLRGGEFLLLNDAPGSFDGRYFGPTRIADIVGRASPLWVR